MDLCRLTIHEAAQLLNRREVSSLELTQAFLDRIRKVDDRVRAFVTVSDALALQQAKEADQKLRLATGHRSPASRR